MTAPFRPTPPTAEEARDEKRRAHEQRLQGRARELALKVEQARTPAERRRAERALDAYINQRRASLTRIYNGGE